MTIVLHLGTCICQKKYMFLQTFSNPENMLAYKEQLFSCLDMRERQKIKMLDLLDYLNKFLLYLYEFYLLIVAT